jgi:hypothetical protein
MTEQSRKSFEEWGHSQNQSGNTDRLQRKGDGYVFTTADIMWQAWQASQARIMEILDSEGMVNIINAAIKANLETDRPSTLAKSAIEAIKQKINE